MGHPTSPSTVLLVTYYFPPQGGIAAHRAVKLARYLPEFGWRPVVLTAASTPPDMRDETLFAELPPETAIVRAPMIGLDGLQRSVRRWLRPWLVHGVMRRTHRRPGLRARARWLLVPDDKVTWLPAAVWYGLRVIHRHDVAAIVSTYPPATGHLIGLWLSILSGRPWIAEFRDPWYANEGLYVPSPAHRALIRSMERAVVRRATLVTATTDVMTEMLARTHHDLPPTHFVTLPNGFDLQDFADPAEPAPRGAFTLVHAGTFKVFTEDRRRTPLYLLRALQSWLGREPERRTDVRVDLVGALEDYLDALIAARGLSDVVRATGFLSHRDAVRRMVSADVLVLIMGEDERTSIPGKLYEYLAAGRPVLALVPEGPAARLIRESGCGVVVPPRDPEQIVSALRQLHAARPAVNPPQVLLESFTRREIARTLAGHLDAITRADRAAQAQHEVAVNR